MILKDLPQDSRPREKLLARGPAALSDAELLAIFLGSGLKGRDAVQTSRDLLTAHGPLRVLRKTARTPWPNCLGWGPHVPAS